jgi:hypothetical protein
MFKLRYFSYSLYNQNSMSKTAPKNIKLYIVIQNIPLWISTALDLALLLMAARYYSIYVFGILFCSLKVFLFLILAVLNYQILQFSSKKYPLFTSNFIFLFSPLDLIYAQKVTKGTKYKNINKYTKNRICGISG